MSKLKGEKSLPFCWHGQHSETKLKEEKMKQEGDEGIKWIDPLILLYWSLRIA